MFCCCKCSKRAFRLGVLPNLCICVILASLMGTIYGLQKLTKHKFLGKFESYNTIHNFKNYFVTVFSTINFFIFSISAVSKHALSTWDARVPRREERPLTNRKERKAVKLEPPQSFSPSSRRPCPGDAWWFRCTVQYPAPSIFFFLSFFTWV